MRQALTGAGLALALLLCGSAAAQETATVRGTIVDEAGQPVPGVAIEFEYKGESRQKIVKAAVSDKKGSYIRSGLRSGPWTVVFAKEGYKTGKLDTSFGAGGLTELPPVKLNAAAAAPTSSAALAPPAGAAGSTVGAERGKQLSAMYDKAVAAMNAGQSAEAEALFKSIVAELPALAAGHYNLGVLYGLRNDAAAAEAEFRKVIELEPKSPSAYLALATILGFTKRSQDAYELLLGAAADFEQDARYQFALGASAFNLGRNAEAETAFGKVVALDPANAEAYFNLGSLALNRNDTAVAVQRLEKYVSIAPAGAENLAAANALIAQLKKK